MVKSGVFGISGQKIIVQLQNVMSYIEFLIDHLGFQYNQIYESYHLNNMNKV